MGRAKGATLPQITPEDRTEWPVGKSVWYPNGSSGWLEGLVDGYTPRYVVVKALGRTRRVRAQPHRLRVRTDFEPPKESPYY